MRIIIYTAVFLLVLLQSMILTEVHRINEIEIVIPEYQSKNKVLGIQITQAILKKETGGNCKAKGGSGEVGCFQFLPSTWKEYIKKYKGTTTLPMTFENEFDVMVTANTKFLEKYTPYQVALIHNQGHAGKCRKGINKHGVKYDSCAYAQSIVAMLK